MIPNMTYTEMKNMSQEEYYTMMAAVDIIEEEREKQLKKK